MQAGKEQRLIQGVGRTLTVSTLPSSLSPQDNGGQMGAQSFDKPLCQMGPQCLLNKQVDQCPRFQTGVDYNGHNGMRKAGNSQ